MSAIQKLIEELSSIEDSDVLTNIYDTINQESTTPTPISVNGIQTDVNKKAESIFEYLQGDWMVDELESLIQTQFPEYSQEKAAKVAQNIADFYVSNNNNEGWEIEEFEAILLGEEFMLTIEF
jgi:hypothetical protein